MLKCVHKKISFMGLSINYEIQKSINKFSLCNVDDTVWVKLTKVDRNKGDPQSVIFAVMSIGGN